MGAKSGEEHSYMAGSFVSEDTWDDLESIVFGVEMGGV